MTGKRLSIQDHRAQAKSRSDRARICLYWSTAALEPQDENNPTAPFSTREVEGMLHRLLAPAILVAAFAPVASATASSELAGTSWRLAGIMSMDDRVDVPDDPSKYVLDLRADGSASMVTDSEIDAYGESPGFMAG